MFTQPPSSPSQSPNTTPYFSPSTIHAMTTLSSLSPTPTPLPPIHPIFLPSSFPALTPTPHLYTLLTPTLRLATHLLLSPPSLTWYAPVLLSSPFPFPQRHLSPLPITRSTLPRVRHLLASHAGKVSFHFRNESVHGAFASCHLRPGARTTRIFLDDSYRTFLEEGYERMGEGQRLRWGLHVAVLLLHELAHSVYMVRFPPRTLNAGVEENEPLHSLDAGEGGAELGSSFERALFGGKIQPVGLEGGCEGGLVWYVWRAEQEVVREFWGVRMEWVEGLWRGEVEVGGPVAVVGVPARVPFSEEGWRNRGG